MGVGSTHDVVLDGANHFGGQLSIASARHVTVNTIDALGLAGTQSAGLWEFLRTAAELTLTSRRIVPTRLLDSGFTFEHPPWPEAAKELMASRAPS